MTRTWWPVLPLLVILIATTTNAATTIAATTAGGHMTTFTGASINSTDGDAATATGPGSMNSTDAVTADPGATETATQGASDDDDSSYSDIGPSGPELVRCYTCDGALSNDDCTGARLGGNGTMQLCDQQFAQCTSEFKMNPTGDGYMIKKGCIDADECYDKMWDSVLDPFNAHCMGSHYSGQNGTLGPEVWCFFCCLSPVTMDGCNLDGHMDRVTLPEDNNWDPNMNWDYTMKETEEEEDNAGHTLTCATSSVIIVSVLYLALSSLL